MVQANKEAKKVNGGIRRMASANNSFLCLLKCCLIIPTNPLVKRTILPNTNQSPSRVGDNNAKMLNESTASK